MADSKRRIENKKEDKKGASAGTKFAKILEWAGYQFDDGAYTLTNEVKKHLYVTLKVVTVFLSINLVAFVWYVLVNRLSVISSDLVGNIGPELQNSVRWILDAGLGLVHGIFVAIVPVCTLYYFLVIGRFGIIAGAVMIVEKGFFALILIWYRLMSALIPDFLEKKFDEGEKFFKVLEQARNDAELTEVTSKSYKGIMNAFVWVITVNTIIIVFPQLCHDLTKLMLVLIGIAVLVLMVYARDTTPYWLEKIEAAQMYFMAGVVLWNSVGFRLYGVIFGSGIYWAAPENVSRRTVIILWMVFFAAVLAWLASISAVKRTFRGGYVRKVSFTSLGLCVLFLLIGLQLMGIVADSLVEMVDAVRNGRPIISASAASLLPNYNTPPPASVVVKNGGSDCIITLPANVRSGIYAQDDYGKNCRIMPGQKFRISTVGQVRVERNHPWVGPEGESGYRDEAVDSPFKDKVGGLEFAFGSLENKRYFAGASYEGTAGENETGIPVFRVINTKLGYQQGVEGYFTVTFSIQ